MRVAVVGFGAVGSRAARLLAADSTFDEIVIVHRDPMRVAAAARDLGEGVELRHGSPGDVPEAEVVVVAAPSGARRAVAAAVANGSHVIAAIDDPSEVRALQGVDATARGAGVTVALGTDMAPGLSCVLAAHISDQFDQVDEIHVASVGTGGPACARRHHSALTAIAVDWEDGEWRRRPAGSGRELVWFPEPVGGADCYRASLADPFLLVPAFPGCRRITSRLEATRRDRMTSWLPMMRAPHPEGLSGAVRVELRGWQAGRAHTTILGAAVAPAIAAGAVTATTARWAAAGRLARPGAAGLAELVGAPGVFLKELAAEGIVVSAFEGGDAGF